MVSEFVCVGMYVHVQVSEWEGVSECVRAWVRVSESEWEGVRGSEWVSEWVWVSERASEWKWVSECESESESEIESESESESDGRAASWSLQYSFSEHSLQRTGINSVWNRDGGNQPFQRLYEELIAFFKTDNMV